MTVIDKILDKVTSTLSGTPGVVGIVLGGSRARGTASQDSDIDIGIYYEADNFDITVMNKKATLLDDMHRADLVTPPGSWGNWVNAGGWLKIDGYHVDLILRDIERVKKIITLSTSGNISMHYQTGHPHAYIDTMYMGELSISSILSDSYDIIAPLQAKTRPYPPKLKKAIISFFTFEAGFSSMFAAHNAAKGDSYYVAAHIVRSVSCLNQILFALNEEYCINEKKSVQMITRFKKAPVDYKQQIDEIISLTGIDTIAACQKLEQLVTETTNITNH